MRRIGAFIKYQLELFFKGSKCVVPTVLLAVFLYAMYYTKPVGVISSFTLSAYLCFGLMVWVGLRVSSTEENVAEELHYLRMQKSRWYYIGKAGFYCTVALILTLICLIYPAFKNLVNGGSMFTTPAGIMEYVNAFCLMFGTGIAGSAIGSFLHPRILPDRKLAIGLTIMLAILIIVKQQVTHDFTFLKIPYLLLPPVDEVIVLYSGKTAFDIVKTLLLLLKLVGYTAVYDTVQGILCDKKKF